MFWTCRPLVVLTQRLMLEGGIGEAEHVALGYSSSFGLWWGPTQAALCLSLLLWSIVLCMGKDNYI